MNSVNFPISFYNFASEAIVLSLYSMLQNVNQSYAHLHLSSRYTFCSEMFAHISYYGSYARKCTFNAVGLTFYLSEHTANNSQYKLERARRLLIVCRLFQAREITWDAGGRGKTRRRKRRKEKDGDLGN